MELECSLGLAQRIVITAHSYGGVVTMSLACSRDMRRLAGVFLTDSVHYALSGDEDMDKMFEELELSQIKKLTDLYKDDFKLHGYESI